MFRHLFYTMKFFRSFILMKKIFSWIGIKIEKERKKIKHNLKDDVLVI